MVGNSIALSEALEQVSRLAAINRPAPEVKLEDIIGGLKEVPGLILQSVLVDGRVSNARGAAYEAWLAALAEIGPSRVQIYSTDRPVPEVGVDKVPPPTLKRLAREIETRTRLQVDACWV